MTMPDPNWRANILARYEQQHQRHNNAKTRFGRSLQPLQVTTTLDFLGPVDEACRVLDVNRFTFIRRAVAVVAANVVGIPVRVLLAESPAPGRYGEQRVRASTAGARDTGEGIEKWCPHPGCDGAHLRT